MTSLDPTSPRRALLCPRVSTDKQWDGTSIETQEEAMRERCAALGWEVAGVLPDAYSGASLWERPQFKELSARIHAGTADVVLFYEPGRLARDQAYSFIVLELCERLGVRLDFVLREYDRDPDGRISTDGRVSFGLDGYFAEKERKAILRRTAEAKARKYADGELMAQGRPPYGYRRVEEETGEAKWNAAGERVRRRRRRVSYALDPATAPVVQRIVRMFLLDRRSLRSITDVLTGEGVPTPTQHAGVKRKGQEPSGIWRTSSVRRILLDPNYYGFPAQRRWRSGTTRKGKPTVVPRDPSEHAPITDGSVPALLPPELCAQYGDVAARLSRNREQATRNNRTPETHLLRGGYARCGYCGGAMIASPAWRGVGPQYKCCRGGQIANGCRKHAILAGTLDDRVWAWMREILDDPEESIPRRAAAYEQHEGPLDAAELDATDRAIAATEAELRNLAENIAKVTGAAADAVAEQMTVRTERLETLRTARGEIARRVEEARARRARADGAVAFARRVKDSLTDQSYAEKREALEAFAARVEVWGTEHDPRFTLEVVLVTDAGEARSVLFTTSRRSEHSLIFRWAA